MFSTSSPTYPASVSAVASAMANGTLSMRERLGEQSLAGARGAQQEDVGLRQLDGVVPVLTAAVLTGLDPLVVVVHRDREGFLGRLLADHVPLEELVDLAGLRELLQRTSLVSASSSSMISLQRSMHSSQMYTPGPAMSFLTCFWLLPQNERLSRSPPSPMRATVCFPFAWETPRSSGSWCCCLMSDGTLPSPLGPPWRGSLCREPRRRATDERQTIQRYVRRPRMILRVEMIWSIRPYASASSAVDLVALDVLADLLDRRGRVLGQHVSSCARIRRISFAAISRSETWPRPVSL